MQIQNSINTEAEYKAALMADGEKVLAILDYIYRRNKDAVFKVENKKVDIEIKKVNNLAELIQELKDANLPTAPEFN